MKDRKEMYNDTTVYKNLYLFCVFIGRVRLKPVKEKGEEERERVRARVRRRSGNALVSFYIIILSLSSNS